MSVYYIDMTSANCPAFNALYEFYSTHWQDLGTQVPACLPQLLADCRASPAGTSAIVMPADAARDLDEMVDKTQLVADAVNQQNALGCIYALSPSADVAEKMQQQNLVVNTCLDAALCATFNAWDIVNRGMAQALEQYAEHQSSASIEYINTYHRCFVHVHHYHQELQQNEALLRAA